MQHSLLALLLALWLMGSSFSPSNIRQLSVDKDESFIRYAVKHRVKDISSNLRIYGSTALYDYQSNTIKDLDTAMKLFSTTDRLIGAHEHNVGTLTGVEQPCITYESTKVVQIGNFLDIKGIMNFHGVKKAVNVLAPITSEYGKLTVQAAIYIKLTDFSIEPPKILTIPIEDQLRIDFKLVFNTL